MDMNVEEQKPRALGAKTTRVGGKMQMVRSGRWDAAVRRAVRVAVQ